MHIVEFAPIRVGKPLAEALRDGKGDPSVEPSLKTLVDAYERNVILGALTASGGHQRRAAARLRVLPTTLCEKIKRLRIRLDRTSSLGSEPDGLLWRGPVAAGGTLEVRSLGGRLRIDQGVSRLVEVTARRSGSRSDRAPLEVRVIEHRHGVSLHAVRSGVDACAEAAAEGDDELELLVRVPPGVDVVASTSHGDVEVVGLSCNVEAATTNGHVIVLPATR